VFTEALRGLEHKLFIVMNKMDRFASLQDFARAYGALCWNLGKVIPRKDLPHLFTTYVPVEGAPRPELPAKDFDAAREELVREIRRAPARRADNLLTQLEEHSRRLAMHARTIAEAGRLLRRFRWKLLGIGALGVAAGILAGAVALQLGASAGVLSAIWGGTALLAAGAGFLGSALSRSHAEQLAAGLDAVFERAYARELLVRERADDLRALWAKVKGRIRESLGKVGAGAFPRLGGAARRRLEEVFEKDVPGLRAGLHRDLGSEP
jgi:hypothetical protein